MNIIYICKFGYASMINLEKQIGNISVATDEKPSPELAMSKVEVEEI